MKNRLAKKKTTLGETIQRAMIVLVIGMLLSVGTILALSYRNITSADCPG